MKKVKYTESLSRAIVNSKELARDLGYDSVEPEHLLLAIIKEKDGGFFMLLKVLGIDIRNLKNAIEEYVPITGNTISQNVAVEFDADVSLALKISAKEAVSLNTTINTVDVVFSILTIECKIARLEILKRFISEVRLMNDLNNNKN
jgi:ATP-dependent Clp protease ATP-binding subunit ClpA